MYRYHAPHPRAHLLRVEAEYHDKAAKRIMAHFVANPSLSERDLANIAIAPFEFKHPLMGSQLPMLLPMPPVSGKQTDAGGLHWLFKQVTPALINMHNEGKIDARWLWEKHIEPALRKDYINAS